MAATYERLDYGSPDGSHWGGASSDALGMYGVTPVSQYPDVGTASTYASSQHSGSGSAATTTFGFSTAAGFSSFVLQVSTITVAGRQLGLWV